MKCRWEKGVLMEVSGRRWGGDEVGGSGWDEVGGTWWDGDGVSRR